MHRGTLHEMIKNETNKCAKQQIDTKPPVSGGASAAVAQQPAAVTAISLKRQQQQCSDIDNNRHAPSQQQHTSIPQRTVNRFTDEVDDNECDQKPLSKSDLIRKFDTKYKQTESVDNKPVHHRSSYEESQSFQCENDSDELENDENIQNSNSEEVAHDFDEHRNRFSESESTTIANNNYANANANANANVNAYSGGSTNANGNETIPPKPLPRTSRNNSVSSLSSEHSLTIANTIEESAGRPVAKPRTTTTSYKVHLLYPSNISFSYIFRFAHCTRTDTRTKEHTFTQTMWFSILCDFQFSFLFIWSWVHFVNVPLFLSFVSFVGHFLIIFKYFVVIWHHFY